MPERPNRLMRLLRRIAGCGDDIDTYNKNKEAILYRARTRSAETAATLPVQVMASSQTEAEIAAHVDPEDVGQIERINALDHKRELEARIDYLVRMRGVRQHGEHGHG